MRTNKLVTLHHATTLGGVSYGLWYRCSIGVELDYVTPELVVYCSKIINATQLAPSTLFLSLYYIYRLRRNNPKLQLPLHAVIVTCLMLANKYLEDNTFTCKTWAHLGKVPLLKLVQLELQILSLFGFRLGVDEQRYALWVERVQCCIHKHKLIVQENPQPMYAMKCVQAKRYRMFQV